MTVTERRKGGTLKSQSMLPSKFNFLPKKPEHLLPQFLHSLSEPSLLSTSNQALGVAAFSIGPEFTRPSAVQFYLLNVCQLGIGEEALQGISLCNSLQAALFDEALLSPKWLLSWVLWWKSIKCGSNYSLNGSRTEAKWGRLIDLTVTVAPLEGLERRLEHRCTTHVFQHWLFSARNVSVLLTWTSLASDSLPHPSITTMCST